MSKEKKQKVYLASLIMGLFTGSVLYFLIQSKSDILWMIGFVIAMLLSENERKKL